MRGMRETVQTVINQVAELVGGYVPNLLGALGILVVGWLVALIVGRIVRGALKRTTLDNRLAKWMAGGDGGRPIEIERYAGKTAFWVVMLFVLVAFFQALNLTIVTEPLNALLNELTRFAPRVLGAVLLLILAALIAVVVRRVVAGALRAAKLDERLAGGADVEAEKSLPVSDALAEALYWLVFLLFLPAILDALALEGLLVPVQSLVDGLLGFLPNILAAGLILAVGWFVAKLVRRIVTNLLAAVGVDRLGARTGMGQVLGSMTLSGLLGLVVYVLILLPVLVSALNAMALDAVTGPASAMLATILDVIPSLFAAAVLLAVAYVIARLVSGLISSLLAGAGFDTLMVQLGLGKTDAPADRTPSALVGRLIVVAVMLFASMEAAELLGFAALVELISRFVVLGGQVILGLIIFAVGLFLANLASTTVQASGSRQAGFLALAARVSIIVLGGAMALRQMGLANEIINIAFGLVLGAVGVAAALAFGLGARDAAGRTVDGWLTALKEGESK